MTDTIPPKPAPDSDMFKKFWLKSKTVWAGIVVFVAGMGDVIKPYTDELREAMGKHWFTIVMVAIGATTVYLRKQTAGGISLRKPDEPPS
jgi:hypothetical protein